MFDIPFYTDQREIILVFGQTGSGKSYLANQISQRCPRVLVASAGFSKDFGAVQSVESLDELWHTLDEKKAFASYAPFRVQYDFRPSYHTDDPGEFPLIFKTAKLLRNVLVVIEEGDRIPYEFDFVESVVRGRHYGISILYISLHPRLVPIELRRQATSIVSFKQIFPDDVQWLAEVVGEEAYKLPTFAGPPIRPPHPCLVWTSRLGARIVAPKEKLAEKQELTHTDNIEVNNA